MKKKIFQLFFKPLFLLVSSIFFSKKYLKGKYFDSNLFGWKKVLFSIFFQKILGYNRKAKWPVSPFISIDDPSSIIFHPDDMNNFWHFGCYYSNSNGGVIKLCKETTLNLDVITKNNK